MGWLNWEMRGLTFNLGRHERKAHNNQLIRSVLIKRFRDNTNLIATIDDPIWEDTKGKLTSMYNLPISKEHTIHTPPLEPAQAELIRSHEQSYTTPEATISITTEEGITLSMKNTECNNTTWNKTTGLKGNGSQKNQNTTEPSQNSPYMPTSTNPCNLPYPRIHKDASTSPI